MLMEPPVKKKHITLCLPRRAKPLSKEELKKHEEVLIATVEKYLGKVFVENVQNIKKIGARALAWHQDAFATSYNIDECTLLGMAIKYAGLHDVQIFVTGKNRETLDKSLQSSSELWGELR